MAITVRFPNGQAVRYNGVNFIKWSTPLSLMDRENGHPIAFVFAESGAILEWQSPCDVSNPLTSKKDAARLVLESIREIPATIARDLKRALQDFNATKYEWRK